MTSSANMARTGLKLTSATKPLQRSYHSVTERRSSSATGSRFIVLPALFPSLTCRLRRCYVCGHAEDRPPGCVYRDQGRGRAAAFRSGAAGGLYGAGGAGLCRAAQSAAVQRGSVQPDLSVGNSVAEIRAAAEAARQAP